LWRKNGKNIAITNEDDYMVLIIDDIFTGFFVVQTSTHLEIMAQ
jgi:hypothetical protein